jgi:hypothetical protein
MAATRFPCEEGFLLQRLGPKINGEMNIWPRDRNFCAAMSNRKEGGVETEFNSFRSEMSM